MFWENWEFWTSLFTAIGTVGAVLVAIYLYMWRERRRRPKLEIKFETGEPFCRQATLQHSGKSSYWARVRVKNNGGRTAVNCRCSMENLFTRDDKTNKLAPISRFDPVMLHWVILPPGNFNPISIPPKDRKLVDIVYGEEGKEILTIRTVPFPRGNIIHIVEKGEYYFLIVAYAENAEPCQQAFRLHWKQKWDDIDMKPLELEEAKNLGLLI